MNLKLKTGAQWSWTQVDTAEDTSDSRCTVTRVSALFWILQLWGKRKAAKILNVHGTCHFLGQQPQSETFTHKHNPNSKSTKHPTSGHLYMWRTVSPAGELTLEQRSELNWEQDFKKLILWFYKCIYSNYNSNSTSCATWPIQFNLIQIHIDELNGGQFLNCEL